MDLCKPLPQHGHPAAACIHRGSGAGAPGPGRPQCLLHIIPIAGPPYIVASTVESRVCTGTLVDYEQTVRECVARPESRKLRERMGTLVHYDYEQTASERVVRPRTASHTSEHWSAWVIVHKWAGSGRGKGDTSTLILVMR
jgi:hypothetical protein